MIICSVMIQDDKRPTGFNTTIIAYGGTKGASIKTQYWPRGGGGFKTDPRDSNLSLKLEGPAFERHLHRLARVGGASALSNMRTPGYSEARVLTTQDKLR